MLYLVPLKKMGDSTLYLHTKDSQCIKDFTEALCEETGSYRVNICLTHTHMSQEDSYARHLDWILQASLSSQKKFLGVPLVDYEKWSERLVSEDSEDGTVLSVKVSADPVVCFRVGLSPFLARTEPLFCDR